MNINKNLRECLFGEYRVKRRGELGLAVEGPQWLPDGLRPERFKPFEVPSIDQLRGAEFSTSQRRVFLVAAVTSLLRSFLAFFDFTKTDGKIHWDKPTPTKLGAEDMTGDEFRAVMSIHPYTYHGVANDYFRELLDLVALEEGAEVVDVLNDMFTRLVLPLRGAIVFGPSLDDHAQERVAKKMPLARSWCGMKREHLLFFRQLGQLVEAVELDAADARPPARGEFEEPSNENDSAVLQYLKLHPAPEVVSTERIHRRAQWPDPQNPPSPLSIRNHFLRRLRKLGHRIEKVPGRGVKYTPK